MIDPFKQIAAYHCPSEVIFKHDIIILNILFGQGGQEGQGGFGDQGDQGGQGSQGSKGGLGRQMSEGS